MKARARNGSSVPSLPSPALASANVPEPWLRAMQEEGQSRWPRVLIIGLSAGPSDTGDVFIPRRLLPRLARVPHSPGLMAGGKPHGWAARSRGGAFHLSRGIFHAGGVETPWLAAAGSQCARAQEPATLPAVA